MKFKNNYKQKNKIKKKQNFYGNFSSGASFAGMDKIYFSNKNLNHIKKEIKKNIKKMNISKDELRDKIIMNVGSGRECLGFLQYRPKKIYHYDISQTNIQNFKKIIKKLNLKNLIISRQLDLSRNKLPKNKFDFIYLHGIIQHVDFVNIGVKNLCTSLKKDGLMWFYFYRPGSLNIFLGSLQRFLVKKTSIKYFLKEVKKKHLNNFIDGIMDDVFVPNRQLFYPTNYNSFLKKNNCKIIGNTYLKNMTKKIDFCKFHASVVFFVKKKSGKKLNIQKDNSHLKRSFGANVLDSKLYKDKNIVKILKYVEKINLNDKKKIIQLIVKIEKVKESIAKKFFMNKKLSINEYTNYIYKIKNILK